MLEKISYIPKNCLGNGIIKEIIVASTKTFTEIRSSYYLPIQLSEKFPPSRLKMELIFFRHTQTLFPETCKMHAAIQCLLEVGFFYKYK